MFVCQWHLDIPYGKQGEAVERARRARLLSGMVGPSASHIVDEYEFDTLADFEAALAGMSAPQFRHPSDALAPYIVRGSQYWVVYRVIEEARPVPGGS
jgi:hypothetical protein